METIPDRIYFKDLESRFVCVNKAQAEWLKAESPAAMVGKTDFEYFAPAHAELARQTEQEIIRTGRASVGQIERLELTDGTVCWGSATKLPWRDSTGRIIGTFGLTRDHTATKQIEEKLNQERTLLRTIIDHLPSRVFVKDRGGRYILNNRAHQRMIGVESQEAALGHTILDYHNDARGERSMVEDHRVLAGGPSIINRESSDLMSDGQRRWALTTKVPLHDPMGKLIARRHHARHHRAQTGEEELRDRTWSGGRLRWRVGARMSSHPELSFSRGGAAGGDALRFAHVTCPPPPGRRLLRGVQTLDTQCVVLVCDGWGTACARVLTALIRAWSRARRRPRTRRMCCRDQRGFLPIFRQTSPVFATVFCGSSNGAPAHFVCECRHPPRCTSASHRTVVPLTLDSPEPPRVWWTISPTHEAKSVRGRRQVLCYTDGVVELLTLPASNLARNASALSRSSSQPIGTELFDKVVSRARLQRRINSRRPLPALD
jgi:sigma-B regulation protein RsbU (phosphoserine phosphatase)